MGRSANRDTVPCWWPDDNPSKQRDAWDSDRSGILAPHSWTIWFVQMVSLYGPEWNLKGPPTVESRIELSKGQKPLEPSQSIQGDIPYAEACNREWSDETWQRLLCWYSMFSHLGRWEVGSQGSRSTKELDGRHWELVQNPRTRIRSCERHDGVTHVCYNPWAKIRILHEEIEQLYVIQVHDIARLMFYIYIYIYFVSSEAPQPIDLERWFASSSS